MPDPASPPDLDALRREIDRIDEAMHALLVERGEVVTRVAAAKRRMGGAEVAGGLAFRPAREAALMERIAARGQGPWRPDTAEGIWRAILGASIHLQTPYALHLDTRAGGEGAVREAARFHFGFSAPLVLHDGPAAVVEAVAREPAAIGLVGAARCLNAGPWWEGLEGEGRPKIAARLPFGERVGHPAAEPLYAVLARAPGEPPATRLVSVRVEGGGERCAIEAAAAFDAALAGAGAATQELDRDGAGTLRLLVALPPGEAAEARLAEALAGPGGRHARPALREVGGHARRLGPAPSAPDAPRA